jgi:hypothetical protein
MNDLRTEVQKLLDIYARRVWPWDIERELRPSMEALRAALSQAEPVIDCRTCRHYTTASGGCLSVIKCVDGVAYQRAGIRQYWRDGNLTG